MAIDRREDAREFYPGGKIISTRPVATGGDMKHSDFAGIEPLPERFTDEDVRTRFNQLVSAAKGASAAVVALLLGTAAFGAGVTVQTAPKGQVYNDEQIVTNVVFDAAGLATTGEVDRVASDAARNLAAVAQSGTNYTDSATNGLLRTETDPTVPSWAKASTQPLPPNYSTVSNRAMTALQSFTETDPVWESEKDDYAKVDDLTSGSLKVDSAYYADEASTAASAGTAEWADGAGWAYTLTGSVSGETRDADVIFQQIDAWTNAATKADATLTELSGYSGWQYGSLTVVGPDPYDWAWTFESPQYDSGTWTTEITTGPEFVTMTATGTEDATSLSFTGSGEGITASGTITRTALSGYRLGPDFASNPNRDKPLASEAEAEDLRTAVAGKVPASRTVNGKALTDDVTLDASDIPTVDSDVATDLYNIRNELDTKADHAYPVTAGNLAALDAQGNPTDSTIPAANVAIKADLRYSLNAATVTPGSSEGWTANYSQIYDSFGELVDVNSPEWDTYSTPDGDKTGWFWLCPDWVYILLSEDESATSLTAYWGGYHGEEYVSYDINFSKTTSPATVTNVLDRAVNTIMLSGNATLTLPSQVSNKSRDFYLKVSANSTATLTVTGATLVDSVGNPVSLAAAAGATVSWHLTETSTNTFLVEGANEMALVGFLGTTKLGKPNYASAESKSNAAGNLDPTTVARITGSGSSAAVTDADLFAATVDCMLYLSLASNTLNSSDVTLKVAPTAIDAASVTIATLHMSNTRVGNTTLPLFLKAGNVVKVTTTGALDSVSGSVVAIE